MMTRSLASNCILIDKLMMSVGFRYLASLLAFCGFESRTYIMCACTNYMCLLSVSTILPCCNGVRHTGISTKSSPIFCPQTFHVRIAVLSSAGAAMVCGVELVADSICGGPLLPKSTSARPNPCSSVSWSCSRPTFPGGLRQPPNQRGAFFLLPASSGQLEQLGLRDQICMSGDPTASFPRPQKRSPAGESRRKISNRIPGLGRAFSPSPTYSRRET